MKLKEAIHILERHNKWRRGEEIPMTDPKELGEAIDTVVFSYGKCIHCGVLVCDVCKCKGLDAVSGSLPSNDKINKELNRIGIPLDHEHAMYFREGVKWCSIMKYELNFKNINDL